MKSKKGTSIISLVLCAVIVTLVTTALVLANRNSAMFRAALEDEDRVVEKSAYIKVYRTTEVRDIAKQAFANNYLAFYDGDVDLEGFKALILGEMMQQIPLNQLEDFDVNVTPDGVTVTKNK